ncbi:hypothetical protein [Faecalibacter macacae]|uniref:Uncharacterized protein n=1 Tax=Faecalibacter macacae TaxID=1859289 RepID=A0A3L9M6D2_9FLAO|nr:hypothetical protein [Faecalibacter macacae]RLZ08575.1 hypothetical protein EAH69_09680 [Faecalibacter macacae]
MRKEDFYKKNDATFLPLGFEKEGIDQMFYYSKCLIKDDIKQEVMNENGLAEEDLPALLIGSTGINQGFCVYTGFCFVWLNITDPVEAIEYASKIVSFEPI